MKLSGVLVICLTNIILRANSTYVPVVLVHNDNHSSLFLLAGFLSFLLLSLRKRKPVTAVTSITSTTSTASTTRQTSTASTTRKTSTASTTSTTSTASTTITTTGPPSRCIVGYTLYRGPGRNFCYRYSSDCKSWDEARTACQTEGADLTSFDEDSLEPFSEVFRQEFPEAGGCFFKRAVWLGAMTNGTRVAIYIDNRIIPSNSPLWEAGEPSTKGECVILSSDTKGTTLFDVTCIFKQNYVCQHF